MHTFLMVCQRTCTDVDEAPFPLPPCKSGCSVVLGNRAGPSRRNAPRLPQYTGTDSALEEKTVKWQSTQGSSPNLDAYLGWNGCQNSLVCYSSAIALNSFLFKRLCNLVISLFKQLLLKLMKLIYNSIKIIRDRWKLMEAPRS